MSPSGSSAMRTARGAGSASKSDGEGWINGARAACRLGREGRGGIAIPRCRGRAAALCRGHPRPRAARRGPLGEAGQRAAMGVVRPVARRGARVACASEGCRAGRSTAEDLGCRRGPTRNVQRESAHGLARAATWSITSVTAEARHIAKMARPIDAMPDDPTQVVTADTPAHRADAGMAWGTLDPRPARARDAAQGRDPRGSAPAGDVADRGGAAAASGDRRGARHRRACRAGGLLVSRAEPRAIRGGAVHGGGRRVS